MTYYVVETQSSNLEVNYPYMYLRDGALVFTASGNPDYILAPGFWVTCTRHEGDL